ncbi:putative porin [Flavobacteriaceae bacterium]|nr:putative porin [Flavobacteriaceae bacterium]MDB9823666.1 putative porin [Flavobacteriaceae bacterium]
MLQRFFVSLLLLTFSFSWAQELEEAMPIPSTVSTVTIDQKQKSKGVDSLAVKKESPVKRKKFIEQMVEEEVIDTATIEMYQIFQQGKRTVFVDTTLTVQKEYKTNFLRRDYFELLPFVNMGSAFNRLGYDFTKGSLQPQMGARSKHFSFYEIEDVKYYRVPTPLTELFFRTTLEQGQLSDALISVNTSPQFNFAVAYRGMRSLGKYVNQRSNAEAFRISLTYQTENERYKAKAHYVSQNLGNQENGGITAEGIALFESGDPDFIERSVLDVRLKSAENSLKGKRSFLEHHFALVQSNEDSGSSWTIGHQIMDETKTYIYTDSSNSAYFGGRVYNTTINDRVRWKIFSNKFETKLINPLLGELTAGVVYSNIDYFFEVPEGTPEEVLPLALETNQGFLNADYLFKWRGFDLTAHFNKTILGDRLSDEVSVQGKISLKNEIFFEGKLSFINKSPNLNFIRYRSNYAAYNWHNENLENEKITNLSATLSHPKWGSISGWLQRLDNFTYYNQLFAEVEAGAEPPLLENQLFTEVVQSADPITYLKLRYQSHYTLGKFALTNTAQYQKVMNDNPSIEVTEAQVINVPEWNLRSTISFSSDAFKKALFFQAGITGHYFSGYYADQYNPLLGDFIRQDRHTIGEYPRIDVFVNAKIKQTRIYFKYEHVNSSFTGYNFYSAVGYPYRDRIIRFGVVWNFFQ